MTNKQYKSYIAVLLLGFAMFAIGNMHRMQTPYQQMQVQTGMLPSSLQTVLAGPFLGVAADYNILQVFSLYGALIAKDASNKEVLWSYLKNRLVTASKQDPYFKDTYRITSGILAFQPGYADDAIHILTDGGHARTWDWESLFIAGFLAHELLNDNTLATKLLQQSAQRPNAPPLAAGVAAKLILEDHGSQASIRFLEQLKSTLPATYRQELDKRIQKIKKGEKK